MKQLGILFIVLGVALFMWRSVEKSQEEDARIAQVVERHQAQKAQAAKVSLPESAADAADPSGASEKPWRHEGRYGKKRIKDIRLGDRVIARNPEVSESERMDFVDPDSSWKQLTLSMIKPDQTKVIVSLLRPQAWMARQDARIGGKIHLVLEELGLDGEAKVLSIDDAPEIKKGEGQVVTGTFHHQAGNVLDIAVKGLEDPIGTTSNHPFWSEDRKAFVQAGDLKVGEQLRQVDGSLTLVSSITNRGPPEKVFNLEVAGEHVYFVSDAGVLVHNTYADKRTLMLGEGDFSHAVAAVKAGHVDPKNLIATAYEKNFVAGAADNIAYLRSKGATVLSDVDATNLSKSFGGQQFDDVIFHMPHTGDHLLWKTNHLVRDFMSSVASGRHLSSSGKLQVRLNNSVGYNRWDMEKMASGFGFNSYQRSIFDLDLYRGFGYEHILTKPRSTPPNFSNGINVHSFGF